MEVLRKHIPPQVRFLFRIYGWGLLAFASLRALLLFTNIVAGFPTPSDYLLIPVSFFYGFRFDTAISCYVLLLPFVLCTFLSFIVPASKAFFFLACHLIVFLYGLAFFIGCADIPYFAQFGSRISSSALLWADSPLFTIRMILGTFSFWIYLVPFILLSFVFARKVKKERDRTLAELNGTPKFFSFPNLIFFFLLAPLVALGLRGRIEKKSPLVTGTAYFCDNNFLNQLGLNAVFTLGSSLQEDLERGNHRLDLMNDEEAIGNVKKYLGSGQGFSSPVARKVEGIGTSRKMNVVFVIMEGMSRFNMGVYGGPENITPVLDSLASKSLWFENFYTQGIHTYNGIYSSLYSYPALLHRHCLAEIPSRKYHSMPQVLKDLGYETSFFITHDGQYDNAEGFLTANGFDRVYSEKDYPSDKILSTLGVPDDYLFDFSIPKMNEIAASGKNFLCCFMTGSNHNPLIFPDWVHLKFKSELEPYQMVEYADWSIGHFLKQASKQSWYNNTIFVFVADHGANYLHTYDMPLAFHRSPLIIFAPGLGLAHQSLDCLAGQIDIFPTLMGLMNLSYTNNTMGVDLLKEKRPFIYFTADDKIGCLDREFYFIHRMYGPETLYRYQTLAMDDQIANFKSRADSMRTYAFSMLQTTQCIVEKEKFSEK